MKRGQTVLIYSSPPGGTLNDVASRKREKHGKPWINVLRWTSSAPPNGAASGQASTHAGRQALGLHSQSLSQSVTRTAVSWASVSGHFILSVAIIVVIFRAISSGWRRRQWENASAVLPCGFCGLRIRFFARLVDLHRDFFFILRRNGAGRNG